MTILQSGIDQFKACYNANAKKQNYSQVAAGPLGPKTCGAASSVPGATCPWAAVIVGDCVASGIVPQYPTRVAPPPATTVLDSMTQYATQQAQSFLQERVEERAAQYPWLTYSDATKTLQAAANALGQRLLETGEISSYCKISTDGKLGPGTCYALRLLGYPKEGYPLPSNCQSFASGCSGQVMTRATPAPPPPTPTVATEPTTDPAVPKNWLEELLAMQPKAWLLAIGAGLLVGGATGYAIHRKK